MLTGPLTATDLAGLLAGDEDSFTEFKSSDTSTKDVAKELCAFLNADGGRLLLGVADDGTPEGFGTWAEESVMNVARTLIEPPTVPTWQTLTVGQVTVAVVSVPRGAEKPYAVGGGEARRYYVRVGSTSREASRDELIRLTQASGAVRPDLRPVLGAEADALDEGRLEALFAGRRTITWSRLDYDERQRVLVAAEILHRDTRTPTVAGLLCFGTDPAAALPQAEVRCAAYAGGQVGRDLVDQAAIRGTVDTMVQDAAAFVERNIRIASTLEGTERVDRPRPSAESVREVIANAVAHRDYGSPGPVLLRVFSDGLEVVSPGRLPNGVTPDAMRIGVSVPRNPFVLDHLVQQRLVDALGRGTILVLEEAAELGLPEPTIEAAEGFVRVRLWWAP